MAGCEDYLDDGCEGAEEGWDQPGWSRHVTGVFGVSRKGAKTRRIKIGKDGKMQKKKIVIYGASGFGREVAWLIQSCDDYEVVCFVDDDASKHGASLNEIAVMSLENASKQFQQELKLMGNNCSNCHKDDEPYERILGKSTLHSLEEMDMAIAEKNIRSVKMSLGETAVKVCARCHGVHRTLSEVRGQLLN